MITIFTPTYNRRRLLVRLYNSLNEQTAHDFEWLIVDDGSTDGTEELVEHFKQESNFPIRYIKKTNAGKHTALNLGFENAHGNYFVCVDSDDYLVVNAIEKAQKLIKEIEGTSLAGFVGMCEDINGNIIGKAPIENLVSDTIQIRDIYKIQGEPEFYNIGYLREARFPIFEDEKFLTEAFVFDQITNKNKLLYTNIVFMVKDFQQGGLSANEPRIRIDSPYGTLNYYKQRMMFSQSAKGKFKAAINYKRFSLHSGKRIILEKNYRFLVYLAAPIAYLLVIIDNRKMKRQKRINKDIQ